MYDVSQRGGGAGRRGVPPRHADVTPGRAANGARTRAVPARPGGPDRARVFRPHNRVHLELV